jgi:hypothetical protein
VGRIVSHLKQRGELREPRRRSISAKRKSRRPYGVRKPRDYMAERPGDLVQVDTLDIRPFPEPSGVLIPDHLVLLRHGRP